MLFSALAVENSDTGGTTRQIKLVECLLKLKQLGYNQLDAVNSKKLCQGTRDDLIGYLIV